MPDPTNQQDEQTAARKKHNTTAAVPDAETPAVPEQPADTSSTLHEPYPGAEFFHGGRHSNIVTAMARRLEAEDCGDGRHLGPDWTNAHKDAFAAWQKQLRPKEGGDVSGIPDRVAWERLQVPRVSPLTEEAR
ncbi:peptidoglycan-binding protein [Streptomyces tibetensis]|uniref:Peptidoglycan-binding protein n=1 Tax=Streptomyces tibetensis TaxID=2382123 RepID=A0ABW6N8L2_9ACTN